MNRALYTLKQIICDPGVGFATGGVLMFAQTSTLGFAATAFCALSSAGLRAVKTLQPAFAQKDNFFNRLMLDERTPLRMLGCAMLTVTGATLATKGIDLGMQVTTAAEFISKGFLPVIVPAITGGVFAVVDFIFAAKLGEALKQKNSPADNASVQPDKKIKMSPYKMIKLAATRPESYMAVGFMGVGLMSGPLAVMAFPFVISAYLTGMRNIIQQKPEHTGYSNLQYLGANFSFGVVATLQGNPLLAIANFMNLPYLAKLQADLTPGGEQQMRKDIITFFKRPFVTKNVNTLVNMAVENTLLPEYHPRQHAALQTLPKAACAFAQAVEPLYPEGSTLLLPISTATAPDIMNNK